MIYEGQIQYITQDDNGNDKNVREKYIILDQNTFAEAEKVLDDEMGMCTDFDVFALKRSKLKEVMNTRKDSDDRIFIADIADTFTDDEGNETQMIYKVALFAKNIDSAYAAVKEYLKQGYDMELVAVKSTKFADVI